MLYNSRYSCGLNRRMHTKFCSSRSVHINGRLVILTDVSTHICRDADERKKKPKLLTILYQFVGIFFQSIDELISINVCLFNMECITFILQSFSCRILLQKYMCLCASVCIKIYICICAYCILRYYSIDIVGSFFTKTALNIIN